MEVSSPASLVLGADLYLVPFVLNAGDPYWLVGAHQQALRDFADWRGEFWQAVVPEAYIVCNPDSAVARLTRAKAPLALEDAVAYARCAEGLFGAPVVYLEYSGDYGDPRLVARVAETLTHSRTFYGGGIDRPERAAQMAAMVDTVVVGNLAHEGEPGLLAETVAAVRSTMGRASGWTRS
jgi:putative glycerol-1-phosphate prenyltransferase